jgi:hypothetical protein
MTSPSDGEGDTSIRMGEEAMGFMFDAEAFKTLRTVHVCGVDVRFQCIDDDPGHVQVA